MKKDDMRIYLDYIKEHDVIEKLDLVFKIVMGSLKNLNHGKRFISKEDFISDFDKWRKSEYEDHKFIPDFKIDKIIPDGVLLDVKFVPFISSMLDLDKSDEIYSWIIQIHNDRPNLLYDEKNNLTKRVNAICRISPPIQIKDEINNSGRRTLTTSIIVFGDDKFFPGLYPRLVKHELVHFILGNMTMFQTTSMPEMVDSIDDEVTKSEFEEFIADLLPFYTIYESDKAVKAFRDSLQRDINPIYSDLYSRILKYLSSNGIPLP